MPLRTVLQRAVSALKGSVLKDSVLMGTALKDGTLKDRVLKGSALKDGALEHSDLKDIVWDGLKGQYVHKREVP